MKKYTLSFLLVAFACFISSAQHGIIKSNWINKNIFQHDVFIENNGQFNSDLKDDRKILFQAVLGDIKAYFLPNGVIYQNVKFISKNNSTDRPERNDPDAEHEVQISNIETMWVGSNINATIETNEAETYFYSYGTKDNQTIKAKLYKGITYKNIYPGIDIEYVFPGEGKSGLKYTIIVHPGADLSLVKLKYNGAASLTMDKSGNIEVQNNIETFIDHAPVSAYAEGGIAEVVYSVNGDEESFRVKNYDKNKTLVIDPWTYMGNFGFTNFGDAYDVDYDDFGNIYIGGDFNPYQIVKLNSSGAIQWLHACFTYDNSNGGYDQTLWGSFTVDKKTGTVYVGEGYNTTGALVEKISTLNGSIIAKYGGATGFMEMWRMIYNPCSDRIIIGGGGTNAPNSQVAILDTSLVSLTPQNPLGTSSAGHDAVLMALDPDGSNCYIELAQSTFDNTYSNYFMSLPVPALTPSNYLASTGYTFQETNSVKYVGPGVDCCGYGVNTTNAMNGMAVHRSKLYMYDGAYLSQWNKNTGAKIGGFITIGGGRKEFNQGGLAVDACGNVYVGDSTSVDIYDSTLALKSSIPVTSMVHDIKISNTGVLYVCGNGFASAYTVPVSGCVDSACGMVTGINTISNENEVNLYPNPNNGKFTIHFDYNSQLINNCQIGIYNVLGQKIYSQALQHAQGDNQIDLSTQPKGIYLYRILSEKGTSISTGKLIIQ